MLGVLEIAFRHHPVAAAGRVAAELQVFLEQLLGRAADADVGPLLSKTWLRLSGILPPCGGVSAAAATAATAAATRAMATSTHTFHVHSDCRRTFLFAGDPGQGRDARLVPQASRGHIPSARLRSIGVGSGVQPGRLTGAHHSGRRPTWPGRPGHAAIAGPCHAAQASRRKPRCQTVFSSPAPDCSTMARGMPARSARELCATIPARSRRCAATSSRLADAQLQHRHRRPAPARGQSRDDRDDRLQPVRAAIERAGAARAAPPRASAPAMSRGGDIGRIAQDEVEAAGQRVAAQSPHRKAARSASPSAAALRRARAAAAGDRSTPTPNAAGNSCSAASSRQPVPVPRSSMRRTAARAREGGQRRLDQRLAIGARDQRGGETAKSRLQNSCRPVISASGSRAARRASSASNGAGRDRPVRPARAAARRCDRHRAAHGPAAGAPPGAACRCRRPRRRAAPSRTRVAHERGSGMTARSFLGRQSRRLVLGGQRVDELVQLAHHDPVDLVQRQIDAVVGHAALREIVGADALAAVAGADLGLAVGRARGMQRRRAAVRTAGRAGSSSPWRGSCAGSSPPASPPRCRSADA